MASKSKFFSWSKGRQSTSEYHRTGGLLAIDTSVGDSGKETFLANGAENTPGPAGRRRPPNLNLTIPPDYSNHRTCLSPASARHNAALVNSASNLLAVVNDMLRSPALGAGVCLRSAEIHKPLPSRPRSISLPSTPDLPAELPGSLFLENQGFPSPPIVGSASRSTMRSVRSGNSLSSSAATKPSPSKVPQHKKSLSETNLQRRSRSRPNLITSPSSTDSKLTTCSVSTNGGHTSSNDSTRVRIGAEKLLQPSPLIVEGKPWRKSNGESSNCRDDLDTPGTPTPTPTTARNRQIEELKSTITAQDHTISTLQAQFGSLRASHEAHVARLVDAHSAEVATLKNYSRVLEEQQSQTRTLHHASSNHLLLLLDTTDQPLSPSRESPQNTASTNSANSIRSFKSAFEQPARSPHHARDSPEMENLKRKLSAARRPETGNRDTIRELNQYKQNNAALQKQIESLMAKLNQSKKNERNLNHTLQEIEKNCAEWQAKASKVEQLEKSTLALQNTIDHLEYRLEMANSEKVDAEEHLFNLQSQSTPFGPQPAKLQVPLAPSNDRQSAHTSMSTVFSSSSPTSHVNDSQEPTTLAAFISHIERLQEQIKQKESRTAEVRAENERLRHDYEQLRREHEGLNLQSDIQGQLLKKSKESDAHIEQLRSAIIDRESIIGEKEESLRMAERQLEHHKLLLHAEIRRHATISLFADSQNDPLPELTSLTSKEDVDRWIERLQSRLKKEKAKHPTKNPSGDTTVDDLNKEIDFYIREIIYYKLDIKGYKSDIKKLKHIATRMGSYGSRASDIESPTPSLGRSIDTPMQARFLSGTPGHGISNTPSPISTGPISAAVSIGRPITPPTAALMTPDPSPANTIKPTPRTHKRVPRKLELTTPPTPHTPPRNAGTNRANEADNVDPGISPRSVARLSPERRKPTPSSPDQEKFGDLATNFPLSTPAAPKRHDTQRSMSDSIIQLYETPRTPEWSPSSNQNQTSSADTGDKKTVETRGRSASMPDPNKSKLTPERPPRPLYGLFESSTAEERIGELPTPLRMDVMAEALRNSPDRAQPPPQLLLSHKASDSAASVIPGPSNSQNKQTNSSNSGSAIPPPLSLRPRAGSASSNTANTQPSSPQQKLSTPSGSNVPFVIAMGSPHNPALITPTTMLPPTTCPITGKCAPLKVTSPTSRTGVGGTMASSTPLTSPVSPTDTSKASFFESAPPVSKSGSATHSRNTSLSSFSMQATRGHSGVENATPRSGGGANSSHSRNASGSSIRSAMQLPGSLMKGKGKARKDSISHPTPLASAFDIDHGISGYGNGIGEAI